VIDLSRVGGSVPDLLVRVRALNRKPIPAPQPVAGHIGRDAGQEPKRAFTPEEREAMWARINAVGAQFKRQPVAGYQPDADDMAAMKAAEAELAARTARVSQ
jgi:hypothetical protein